MKKPKTGDKDVGRVMHFEGAPERGLDPDGYITIFSDASFCNKTKASGFGGWVRLPTESRAHITRGAYSSRDNNVAELEGINRTLWFAMTKTSFDGVRVVIQCDCEWALREFIDKHMEMLRDLNPKSIKIKHVKGHQSFNNPRYKVNNMCDQIAKQEMVRFRDNLLRKGSINDGIFGSP